MMEQGNNRTKTIVRVSYHGIVANLVLVAFKAVIGILANSIAVILDAVNNLSDALSSVITIVGTRLASRKADRKHPYGHGRIEYITSTVIAVIVLVAGVTAFKESIEKIIHPVQTDFRWYSLVIISAAVLVKILLGRYFQKKGNELNSVSLAASGSDAIFDAILSFATLVSAAISMIWQINLEGYLGVGISVFILKAGIGSLRDAINDIIGVRIDTRLSSELKEQITSYPGVYGAYDLILHDYGPGLMMGSVHIEVDDGLTAREIDTMTRAVTAGIYHKFGVILTVGIYAANNSDPESVAIRALVREEIGKHPEILQMHGFYMEPEKKVISLDIIVDFGTPDSPRIAEEVRGAIEAKYPGYKVYVNLDRDFSD